MAEGVEGSGETCVSGTVDVCSGSSTAKLVRVPNSGPFHLMPSCVITAPSFITEFDNLEFPICFTSTCGGPGHCFGDGSLTGGFMLNAL